jgi:hypothetical protein
MKYVIRRLVAGLLIAPTVAVAYVCLYAFLILIGGEPTSGIVDTFNNGLWMGGVVAIGLQFIHKLNK